eukprot:TRINITY_DN4598_c0_g1_i2.p1 TRINITY_DN4598_c0_g1~~TRINITY_DN4598_c0_g1_i2.p1  ORF type:complete len:564 (-),score=59.18 TRINITY_DN4598_c0_g1_i2:184-1875(-)
MSVEVTNRYSKLRINDKIFEVEKNLLCEKSDYFQALFNPAFADSNQEIITIKDLVDVDDFEIILKYCQTGLVDLPDALSNLLKLLQTSQALAFDQIFNLCIAEIKKRLTDTRETNSILDIFKASEIVNSEELSSLCLKKISLNFDSIDIDYFTSLHFTEESIVKLASYPQLTCENDNKLLIMIRKWNDGKELCSNLHWKLITIQLSMMENYVWTKGHMISTETKMNIESLISVLRAKKKTQLCEQSDLDQAFQFSLRSSWTYLCFLGSEKPLQKNQANNYSVHCYTFNPRLRELEVGFDFDKDNPGPQQEILKGSSVTSLAEGFILAGGEYKYGKNAWNMEIIKYQYSSGTTFTRESKVGELSCPRRHHTAVLIMDNLYLIGGFSSTRVMLSNMERINLTSGETSLVELPGRGYNVAATEYKGKIVVAMKGGIYIYSEEMKTWLQRIIKTDTMPSNVEFHHAFCFQNYLYLTCNYQRSVYRVQLDNPDLAEIKLVGDLANEAQRPFAQGPMLYNLARSDVLDFDGSGEKVIEMFDVRTGVTTIQYKFEVPVLVQDFPIFWIIK